MKSIRKNEALKADKQCPGCLGRMVNLFDLSAGVSANRLLTDKPHCEGPHLKHQSEVSSTVGTSAGNKLEDKRLYPDLRSMPDRNSHSTPMKMLMSQEMSKEIKSKHVLPNAIAKLMGLDALPQQQHHVVMKRTHSKDYSHRISSHLGEPTQYWSQEQDILDERMKWKAHDNKGHGNYRDVYEIRKENQKMNSFRGKSPQRGMYSEKEAKRKMELVRQKFLEAKRLATNEKLRQSKDFQDAVEVLSSNKEFFLKFLQEPSSLISKHLYEWQSICAPPETRRITVLKPSKMVNLERFPTREEKNEYPIKSPAQVVQETYPGYDVDEYANQPTRIVVLKPNAGKMCEIKSSVSVSYPSPRILHGENAFEAGHSRTGELRQVVEENICHTHRKLMGDWRDETLTSAAFGDKTLFNQSENQCEVESYHNFEVMSPNSWHSWDCIDGFGSPFSSALNRKSCSPDSSVRREAKRRLSERWAMMAFSGGSQEGRFSQRRSNTLAEMLALSDTKKSVMNRGKANEREVGTSLLDKGNTIDMPVNLQRSKSLPASSTKHGMKSYLEPAIHEACKANSLKDPTKKSTASSFKGKFSSFFFPRNKRSSKSKCIPSRSTEESQSVASDTAESSMSAYPHDKVIYYVNQFAEDGQLEECSSPVSGFFDRSFPDATKMWQMQGMVPQEGETSNLNPAIRGYSIDNPDQPSPISVLELPYEEDDTATPESSGKQPAPVHHLMSNLISKSPPIESIARTLSWDCPCSGSASPNHSEPSPFEMVEQDWLILVRKILSAAGLDEETQWDAFFFNWHSPDSPLDASLLNRIMSMDEEEPLHEATRYLQRLNTKLVFDCVNEALVESTGHGLDPSGPRQPVLSSGELLLDRVWALVREWLSAAGDEWDGHYLAVEMAMREKVVVRRGQWTENFRLEMGELAKEIELELLQDILDETLVVLL